MARIAIVDDDASLAAAIEEALTQAGHEAFVARDAEELEFRVLGRMPDLALIDMQFRGGGGPAASRLLGEEIPIIVLSGMPVAKQAEWFKDRKRVRHFTKPLPLAELLKAVDEMLSGR